jgi:transcriptional regulator with XRE-family HTH domain
VGVDLSQRQKKERSYHALIREIVRRRKAAGITQVELAEAIGSDQSHISKYERRERELGIIDFVRICLAIGAAPSKVLGTVSIGVKRRRKPKQRKTP